MRTHLSIIALALCFTAPGFAEDKKEGSIDLEVKGTLTTGIVAIGGESTGATITTKDGFSCEVAGVKDDKLNKKSVVVKGSFAVKPGVEVGQRRILTAASVEEATDKPDENYVKAKIKGKLATGILAPGGATTGVTITAAGTTWELDLRKDKDMVAAAEKLTGKEILVEGTVEVKKLGTRPGTRTIVSVTSLKGAE
jgi:hypothetical protein